MNIAELFVNLFVKGGDKASKDIKELDKSLKGAEESALLTKAAIIGMIYGLERLTGFASQAGMDLNKFALVTGLSTDELQKWQYVARTYDVTGEEMAGTIRQLQSATTDMMLGKGMPAGAAALGIKMTRDPFELLKQLAKAAKALPPDIASTLIKSFGVSDNVFQMLRASNLELDKMSKKDIISAKEIERLTKVNKAWKDFWFALRTMGIKLVAREGLGAVQQLADGFKVLIDVGQWVLKLMDQFYALKVVVGIVALAILAAFAPVTAAVAGLLLLLPQLKKFKDEVDHGTNKGVNDIKERWNDPNKGFFSKLWEQVNDHSQLDKATEASKMAAKPGDTERYREAMGLGFLNKILPGSMEPPAPALGQPSAAPTGGATPAVTVNNYGVEHPKETGDATKRGITDAYRQRAANAGGI